MSEAPACIAPHPNPRKPRHQLPPGSTDCHCHVFEDPKKYPLTENRSYTPPYLPLTRYLAMCDTVGLQRTVQVNASVYGYDNSLSLDVIASLGQHRARGVAGVRPDVTLEELARLNAGGFRGARLSTHVKGYGGTELIDVLAEKVAPLGWHLQLHVGKNAELAELEARLMKMPAALVFDHLGCVRGERDTVDAPGFRALLRMLQKRNDCWVKISSWYHRSQSGPPAYADMQPFAQALVAARPDRVVFGTNWPHPNHYPPEVNPDDGDLIDIFCDWFPDAAVRKRILVDNPAQLYGFPPA
ncbi:MAG: amidohydrolase family protein [Burkholderiales bacterium]